MNLYESTVTFFLNKIFRYILLLICMVFLLAELAHSMPLYMTFETSWATGPQYQFTFMFDRDRDAYIVNENGDTVILQDTYNSAADSFFDRSGIDYFYVEYVSGNWVELPDYLGEKEFHVGSTDMYYSEQTGEYLGGMWWNLRVGSEDDFINFNHYGSGIDNAVQNPFGLLPSMTTIPSMDVWNESYFVSISSIPPALPVPEPSTMILFGVGVIGLAGVQFRKIDKEMVIFLRQ